MRHWENIFQLIVGASAKKIRKSSGGVKHNRFNTMDYRECLGLFIRAQLQLSLSLYQKGYRLTNFSRAPFDSKNQ